MLFKSTRFLYCEEICKILHIIITALKQKLTHIPEEIKDRSKFLLIIRHIASAIKDVLDAVNEVSQGHRNDPRMTREHRKVERLGFVW